MEFTEEQIAQLERQAARQKKKEDSGQREGEATIYHEDDPEELDFDDHG